MSVSFGYKLIFLDHPRTAGTSTQSGLIKIGGKPHKRHTHITGYPSIICCTVRNPYDLLVSWYLIQIKRDVFIGSLLKFVKTYENYNFTRGGRLFYFLEFCNEVMRFETLQDDLNRVLTKVKLKTFTLLHENKTEDRRPYTEYYDEKTIAAVKRRFAVDIKEFGYEF